MKFNPGDKVKFLNEKGGGIITKILGPTMVSVAIEDGFEVPTLIKNLVIMDSGDAYKKKFDENFHISTELPGGKIDEVEEFDHRITSLDRNFTKKEFSPGLYFAFAPHDQRMLITGYVDLIVVNNTEYEVLYNLFLKNSNGFEGLDFGSVTPFSKIIIGSVDQSQILDWCEGVIQFLFHKNNNDFIISPVDRNFKIKPSKFLKEDNYYYNKLVNQKALLVELFLLENTVDEIKVDKELIKSNILKTESIILKHKTDDESAEVDLHLHVLVDDESRLNNSEKMKIQLDYFVRCLEAAIKENLKKVVFIHGVGAGVLKYEINNILKEYENLEHFDASIAKYGIGATEVLIYKDQK
jgi:hypothetical protein